MRILITSFTYFPDTNGVQNITEKQAEGLVKLGHDVTVISGSRSTQFKKKEIHNGVKIMRIHAYDEWMLHFGEKKKFQKYLIENSHKYDVMMNVCLESWSTDWVLPIVDKVKCKSFMMIHGISNMSWQRFHDYSIYGISRKVYGDIRWRLTFPFIWEDIKKYNAIAQLHENDYANEYFRKHKINDCKILYNFVQDEFFVEDVKKEPIIINIGALCQNKNQCLALDVFYKMENKDYKLVIIGPEKNSYYNKIILHMNELEAKYGHRNVEILVGIDRAKTIEFVRKSQIYLMTSISEMFPVVILEAMAAKAAFVSTDVGINRFLPGGIVGKNEKELIKAVNEMTNNDGWIDYGKAGNRFADSNCRMDSQVKKLESVLMEL